MAELGDGNGTGYPAALDTDTTQESASLIARQEVPNDIAAAIVAVETELGTLPQGTVDDLRTRLAVALENDGTVKHSHLLSEQICRIKTGTYTGNGSTDQDITGVGFDPLFVAIWVDDGGNAGCWIRGNWSADESYKEKPAGGHEANTDEIISLDTDGFSVDDAGADSHPNTDTEIYYYIALG